MVEIDKLKLHTDVLKKANKQELPIARLEEELGIYAGSVRKLLLETNHRAEVLITIILYTGNTVEYYLKNKSKKK